MVTFLLIKCLNNWPICWILYIIEGENDTINVIIFDWRLQNTVWGCCEDGVSEATGKATAVSNVNLNAMIYRSNDQSYMQLHANNTDLRPTRIISSMWCKFIML